MQHSGCDPTKTWLGQGARYRIHSNDLRIGGVGMFRARAEFAHVNGCGSSPELGRRPFSIYAKIRVKHMCGMCGVVVYGWREGQDPAAVLRMRDAMVHRGPDDAGEYMSPDRRVAFGHRRLSIVDLSAAGRQPMCNEDGTVWIVFNGEIYNHLELRKELEGRGHRYRSGTDTETLLHLYEEEGERMLNSLRGMFAFAIWDERRRSLFAARDRIGIKPLYYTQVDGRFMFASEIKALAEHPSVVLDVDDTALYHYLSFMTTPAPTTLFRGICKLPPGHYLTLTEDGTCTVERWWDLAWAMPPGSEHLKSPDACADRIRELLKESVRERLMADVPFGVLLSGGVDSTALVALTRELHSGPLRTFSVGFSDAPALNELEHARVAARHFGTEHHEIVVDPAAVLRYIPALIDAQDEPLADWVCVPLHYVCKLVRDSGTIVGLVGEGSDEQFFGYSHYHRYARLHRGVWAAYCKMPRAVRSTLHHLLDAPLRNAGLPREIRELFRRAAADEPLFLSGAVAAWETDKRDFAAKLQPPSWAGLSSTPVATIAAERFRQHRPQAGFVETMIYQELQLRLPELLLMRVDKIGMANSIEPRVPFLDHRLVEFTSYIPAAWNTGGGRTKDLLKRAVTDLVPEYVITRHKQGFSLPVKKWLRGPLAEFARRSILDSAIRERGYFDYDAIENIINAHVQGRQNSDTLIWSLINVSQWYDRWIAKRSLETGMAT
jgi:asparagine synthase (glutamine-hydrolysing)